MKTKTLYFYLCTVLFICVQGYGDGIIVLDQNNFEQVLSQVNFVLVEFYLPGCSSCHQFAHEYAKAAQVLSPYSPRIKFFEVDGSTENTLVKQYNIKSFPTTMLFIKGSDTPLEYKRGPNVDEIVEWVMNKCLSTIKEVNTIEEVQKIIYENKLVGLFFGQLKTEEHEKFLEVARQFDDIFFIESQNQNLKRHLEIQKEPVFVFFKHFDEEKEIFEGPFLSKNLMEYINIQKHPALLCYSEQVEEKVFRQGQNAILLFVNRDDTQRTKEAEAIVNRVAKQLKEKFVFTVVNFDDEIELFLSPMTSTLLNEFFLVKRNSLPVLRLFQPSNKMRRYLFNEEIGFDNLKTFIENFKKGDLTPLYMSGPIPSKSYDGNVRIVVQNNYKETVLDNVKNVLVLLCNPHHYICRNFYQIFNNVAGKFKNNNDIVFAKVDVSINDIEGVEQNSTLDLLFYPKGRKSSPILFLDNVDELALCEWIQNNLSTSTTTHSRIE